MKPGQFSLSAIGAAMHRAIHQKLEGGSVFKDKFAIEILDPGELQKAELAAASEDRSNRGFRIFMAARSRLAEDLMADAIDSGVRQIVVLGAGLDTFSLRNPFADLGVKVFEIDHPQTQVLKLNRIAKMRYVSSDLSKFVSVDFENQDLRHELARSGFIDSNPSFFMWLGVVPYLSQDAIFKTLRFICDVPRSQVVFDYSEPLENYDARRRIMVAAIAERLAALGEPWISLFDPLTLTENLKEMGFREVDDLDMANICSRYGHAFQGVSPPETGPHVISARNFHRSAAI